VHIDIVSDAICPWCYIGKRKLDQALALVADEMTVSLRWRPYQLNPSTPALGLDRQASLAKKFGSAQRAQAVFARIAQTGTEDGIEFDFDAIERTPNTVDVHRLIEWAGPGQRQHDLVAGLFAAYFERGEDIGATAVLIAAAVSVGMDAEVVAQQLAADGEREVIAEQEQLARSMGIGGVPCFIVNGQYMLMGVQDPVRLARALKKIHQEELDAPVDYPIFGSL